MFCLVFQLNNLKNHVVNVVVKPYLKRFGVVVEFNMQHNFFKVLFRLRIAPLTGSNRSVVPFYRT